MFDRKVWIQILDHPKASLIACCAAWKLLLLGIALLSPGLGYDTSTTLLYNGKASTNNLSTAIWPSNLWLDNLVRWDAIYFTQIAQRGYSWEQEWAFGWGFTKLIAFVGGFPYLEKVVGDTDCEVFAGVLIAHIFHVLSVLMLHDLTLAVHPKNSMARHTRFAFLAASLHVMSPAGIFLSAPYAESPFSFLNFLGFYLYAKTFAGDQPQKFGASSILLTISSGVSFGVATTFRGNGLLSGLIFVHGIIDCITTMWRSRQIGSDLAVFTTLCASGILMASIAFAPQYLAYKEFCCGPNPGEGVRPWCSNWLPSIYAWVQKEYWGVRFLRYWTISNMPLFLLATPVLSILLFSFCWSLHTNMPLSKDGKSRRGIKSVQSQWGDFETLKYRETAIRFAIPQIALALLALTTYHVQIITRLASGYPVWYWWLASLILEDHKTRILGYYFGTADLVMRWMIMYAIIQGGLFASFLPPA